MSGRTTLLLVNGIGGIGVLASYVNGIDSPHTASGGIWGGVPEAAQGLYTVSMFTAASGYFPFTYLFTFGVDPVRARFMGFRLSFVTALYALVLFPSAMWLPLTARYLDAPSSGGWLAIQAVLATVAIASLGLLACIVTLTPSPPRWLRIASITGALFFCFQTVVLDAVIWVVSFPN
ncbi:MAG: hypothetical protein VX246_02460 [Myxococcota bacterium]|nr:hypothetical protein [Myxococcota bacterium]